MDVVGWEDYGQTTRICPKCGGSQILILPAKNDVPPKNAFAYVLYLGTPIRWFVWCDCQEGYV